MTLPTLLTVAEAAARLGLTTRQIRYMRSNGLKFIPGRRILIDEKDLNSFAADKKRLNTSSSPIAPLTQGEAIERGRRAFRMAQLRRNPLKWVQNAKLK